MENDQNLVLSHKRLLQALEKETHQFKEHYIWLDQAMPPLFFQEVSPEDVMLITHSLVGFELQQHFSTILLKKAAIVLCQESPDADLKILKDYALYGIKNYQTYVSKVNFPGTGKPLRIAQIFFTEAKPQEENHYPDHQKQELFALVKQRNPHVTQNEFEKLISSISLPFLKALSNDLLILLLDMYFRSKTRDNCQYEVRYNENWQEEQTASMHIVLAWKNTPKHNFLYRIARIINRYNLVMKKVDAAYVDPYKKDSTLLMALRLHGGDGRAVWDVADIHNFLRELVTIKYFASFDLIDEKLVKTKAIAGHLANFLRASVDFVHQALVSIDSNLYTVERIEQDLTRHPELTAELCRCFSLKFDPDLHDWTSYQTAKADLEKSIKNLDTGNPENDLRRQNVLLTALNFIHYTLKTNYFRLNYTAASFRLDPGYLDEIPFDRQKIFPELPFGIFFMKGMHFFGFHIRFKDLSRGGLRTIYPKQPEQMASERTRVFQECYNLALTQQKKNKDIPEGGSKGVIFLKPFERIESEALILKNELEDALIEDEEIEKQLIQFRTEQQEEILYQAQRSYIESLITLINCDPDGRIRAKYMVDYWKRPEYIYLGPDENMHDSMIEWIADFSKKYGYLPGSAFITSKPKVGINHKKYGVTSLGLNCYLHSLLVYLGIDPEKQEFTLKMSGGPDGDVAGNQLKNLYRFYPKTAKLLSLTDVSGTIFDPKGLDLKILADLFDQVKSISHYPPEKLNPGGFLLDKTTTQNPSAFVQQTLLWKKEGRKLEKVWLSGNEMNRLFSDNVHSTKVDVFIPAGGRPRTLNKDNVTDYLDESGLPTSKGIVEGANLYLTDDARTFLENRGCLIIKDSSANKAGVICSSFEVLSGLALGDELFLENKEELVEEILERLKECAENEARILLEAHKKTGAPLTKISDEISYKINHYTYQIFDYLAPIELSKDLNDPLNIAFLDYCPKILKEKYLDRLMKEIPPIHKKAIISCHIAAGVIYGRGLDWSPSIIDVLPALFK